jgi:dsRNA-specific ribonuclease
VQVLVNAEEWGHGIARSKQLAEVAAAKQALERCSEDEPARAARAAGEGPHDA